MGRWGRTGIATQTLALSVVIGLATAGFLAYAGHLTQRRRAAGDERIAMLAFATWWYGASLVILNQTVRTLFAVAGVEDMAVYMVLAYFGNLPLAAALAGLLYYILFLLTGRRRLFVPIVTLYALYFGYLVWFTNRGGERTLEIGEWQAQLSAEFAATPADNLLFGLLLAVPLFLTVGAYAVLLFRVEDRSQRYRVGMVVAGFLLLFGTILVGYLLRWNEQPWFPLAYQLPALLTALLAVLGFRPPPWLERHFGIRPADAA